MKKLVSIFLALLIVLLLLPDMNRAQAATYSDIGGHWAKDAIMRWSDLGILTGNNGKFNPNGPITRGELATILNRVLRFPEVADGPFTDIAGAWYEKNINACAWQGVYIVDRGEARGSQAATREEAVEMIARAFAIGWSGNKKEFTDNDEISAEYRDSINQFYTAGFIQGSGGKFNPKGTFTRAQVVQILDNMIDAYITEPGVYDKPLGEKICVAVPGVVLRNQLATIQYFVITPGAAAGKTTLVGSAPRSAILIATFWTHSAWDDDDYFDRGNDFNMYGLRNTYACKTLKIRPADVGSAGAGFAGGSGTASDPYQIENQAQLEALNSYYGSEYSSVFFKLTKDIQLSGKWDPIGHKSSAAFYATLDGAGHTISGMDITADSSSGKTFGLIKILDGVIRNLKVSGKIDVKSETPGANLNAGGIAGSASSGIIHNCVSNVDIKAAADGDVYAGGIVGYGFGVTVGACSFSGNISASASKSAFAGGITGLTDKSSFNGCTTGGTIKAQTSSRAEDETPNAGGILGAAVTSTIQNCYSTADITVSGGYYSFAGGAAGLLSNGVTATGCFAAGKVHAENALMQNNAGGFAGQINGRQNAYTRVSACGASADVTASGDTIYFNAVGGFAGSMYEYTSAVNCYSAGSVSCSYSASIAGFIGRAAGNLENCYTSSAVSASRPLNDLSIQGLIGTIRSNIVTKSCGSFIDRNLHFSSVADSGLAVITDATKAALQKADVFKAQGWDFEKTWVMPPAGASYKLPILRGSYEKEQGAAAMPNHLR